MKLCVPIFDVDRKKRMVRAFLPASEIRNQHVSITGEGLAKAAVNYDGCLRSMSSTPSAAGRVLKILADEGGVALSARISDENDWRKLESGTYVSLALSLKENDEGEPALHMVFLSDSPAGDCYNVTSGLHGINAMDKDASHEVHQSPLDAMREALKRPVRWP